MDVRNTYSCRVKGRMLLVWVPLFALHFSLAQAARPAKGQLKALLAEVNILKRSDALLAFEKVNAFEAEFELTKDETLELLHAKTRISIRDQFHFNYPKYLREYMLEAKRLENQKHIYISQRLLFIFHLFNESAKKNWVEKGIAFFENEQDTTQMLLSYAVLYTHYMQRQQVDSGAFYASKIIDQFAYVRRTPEIVNLLSVPCELYSTFQFNDSLFQYYKKVALDAGSIRHPKDSVHFLKNEISRAFYLNDLNAIPPIFKTVYKLCPSNSYFDMRLKSQFLGIEKYYYQLVDSVEKALAVSNEYTKISQQLNLQFHQALMDDLMNGELLTSLEVSQQKDQEEKWRLRAIVIGLLLSLTIAVLVGSKVLKDRKKLYHQKLLTHEKEQELLKMKLANEQLENERKQAEIESGKKDILVLSSGLKQKTQLLYDLKEQLKTANASSDGNQKAVSDAILKISSSGSFSNDWDSIYAKYQELNPGFFSNLNQVGDGLSVGDLKLSALISLNFSNEEIAEVMHIETRSVVIKKHRLKKKLELTKDDNLNEYLRRMG